MREPDPSEWNPSGVVTLLTDFGLEDPYVGIMKGVLLDRCPGLQTVDLTHAVAPQDTRGAAWFLSQSWAWFPAGTVHVSVVDPGVGSERAILVARSEGHVFLAPDNGLLGPVLAPDARVYRLEAARYTRGTPSRTFHGRDVFAPTAAALAAGEAPERTGPRIDDWQRLEFPEPVRDGDVLAAEVLVVDRFGNLITNLNPVAAGLTLEDWTVEVQGHRLPLGGTYADVAPGEALALIDSYGHLEVAVRDGHGADALALGRGATITLRRRL